MREENDDMPLGGTARLLPAFCGAKWLRFSKGFA
jgi:hypothetical protein